MASRQRRQTAAYGVLAGLAAGHHHDVGAVAEGVLVEKMADVEGAVGRCDHDDQGDGAGGGHRADGVHQHRGAAQGAQRLGGAGAEPDTAAGGGNHRGGADRTGGIRHRRLRSSGATPELAQTGLFPRGRWVWPQRAGRDALTGPLP